MLQGTGSDVGKSLLVAGLCRALVRRKFAVRPFKPQNMSNNAAVTADGGEIGRAQSLQARAACTPSSVHMNPVLLKPESDTGSQVVVQGKVLGHAKAADYTRMKRDLLPRVLESYHSLAAEADVMVVEGAGSAAEVNLRQYDIANMGFAEAAHIPVILVGDIDRGGVIAQIIGTFDVLSPADRQHLQGYIINKFRGDPALFAPALETIFERTGLRCLGIVPYWPGAGLLPAEDSASAKSQGAANGAIHIAIPQLPRMANFDDMDPLAAEPDVRLNWVPPGQPLPRDADLIILPGSKSTLGDLAFLRAQGWDIDIAAHVRHGGPVLGICAGFQMLGRTIADPLGVEGPKGGVAPGLGFLDMETTMAGDKILREVSGCDSDGAPIKGYEMHMGRTTGPDTARFMVTLDGRADGAVSGDGLIQGCYLHGLFASDPWRAKFLAPFRGGRQASAPWEARVEETLDQLAEHLETHLDMDALLRIVFPKAT